ncbi:MAG: DUF975 family protein [Lachnospiraceae bacterium]|nr:DUF975 family protein [Lachnospiraceae bacterium]
MKKTSISDLKLAAKDRLLGSYGIATGTFALVFALIYTLLMVLVFSMIGSGLMTSGNGTMGASVKSLLISTVFSLVIGALSSVMFVGYISVIMKISRGDRPVISDAFFVLKNHPDKVIIISIIMTVVQMILLLPSNIVSLSGVTEAKRFLLWTVLYVLGFIASLVFNMYLGLCYMLYIDDVDMDVKYFVTESVRLMKGNIFRYLYLHLSFIGYYVLVFMSLGVAILWVAPYQYMTMVQFYEDLRQ